MEIDGIIYYNKLVEDELNMGEARPPTIGRSRTLFGDYKNRMDLVRSGIIVCRNVPRFHRYVGLGCNPDSGKTERKFALFPSHVDLYNHIMKIPVEKRSFFEVIQGNKPHKPHFDIDFDMTNGLNHDSVISIMSNIIDAIIDTVNNNGIKLDLNKDILIYTSSRPEKASYHIIINGWMHNDNKDAKNLAKQVRCQFPSEIADYIDKSVYSTKQQFRILHCTKLRTKNTKVPVPIWKTSKYTITYPNIHNKYDEFLASLVGVTIGCNFIPPFIDPSGAITTGGTNGTISQVESTGNTSIEYKIELKKNDVDKCLQELYRRTEEAIGCARNMSSVWNAFSVRSIEGGFISLTKRRPYFCPICLRQHENENPYMTVNGNGMVKYHCRRAEKSMPITTLPDIGERSSLNIDIHEDNVEDVDSPIPEVYEEQFPQFIQHRTLIPIDQVQNLKLNLPKRVVEQEYVEKLPSGFEIHYNYNRWKR